MSIKKRKKSEMKKRNLFSFLQTKNKKKKNVIKIVKTQLKKIRGFPKSHNSPNRRLPPCVLRHPLNPSLCPR